MKGQKLAAIAAALEEWSTPPTEWRELLKWATTTELDNLGVAERENPEHLRGLEEIRRRCEWRYLLKLGPRMRCIARRSNTACDCGEKALDELSADELAWLSGPEEAKQRVRELAQRHHVPIPRRRFSLRQPPARKQEPKPSKVGAPAPAPAPQRPPLEKLTETPTGPLKPRYRTRRGPPHPPSWEAFRRGEHGPSRGDLLDHRF